MKLDENILESMGKLPPFPVVVQRAIQLLSDPNASTQDIVEAIQFDPSITANVLKVCNSAYFGIRRTIHSLKESLVMIGFNQLLEIILSQESTNLFSSGGKGSDAHFGELWSHSVTTALLSRIVALRLHHEVNPTYFTAALLHDIGKVALHRFVKNYLGEVKKCAQADQISFEEAEQKIFGFDHAEIGGRITEQWNFPYEICACVRYHHTPYLAREDSGMVHVIYLCDRLAVVTGATGGAEKLSDEACKEIMKQYNLKEEDLEQFMVQLKERFQLVKEALTVTGGDKQASLAQAS
jgi:putative nucleotidyltransferase with HDIG domain